ncbi:MAG: ribosome recycling factor [Geminicoccaceae bacterium]|jgi:ribosome recycling factor|nr:ribosome recycling factor [Geminicoccaceae bacterium]MCE3246464.1 ribosome recycling factor [Geminicoccaceae bacterium]
MSGFDMADLKKRMNGAVEVLRKEFAGLRTGRASASLLEPISVQAYGSEMPLNQVGTVGVPEPRMLSVQVWDKSLVKAVEKAIRTSDLGLNPAVEGTLIRVPIPELSQERRAELAKVAARYAEAARVAVRNVRRDGMEQLKRQEKDGDLSQDAHHKISHQVQELTDSEIKQINDMLAAKESEIMTI